VITASVRGPMHRFLAFAGAVLVLGFATAACERPRSTKPTIVLIVTDDQRWDTLWAMPTVRRELMAHGVTFRNGFVTTPLCCPSRASILTGAYAHTTGVWQNRGPVGGFRRFRDRSTVATWLDRAGYNTALFGKYLNGYHGTYVPPGWDRWVAIAGAVDPYDLYYRYTLNIDGNLRRFGTGPEHYSTSVLAKEAFSHILTTPGPLFVYFSPYNPHTPVKPAPEDRNAFAGAAPRHPQSFNERDVSDKPRWVQGLPRLPLVTKAQVVTRYRRISASLLALDRAVSAIIEALRATGRLENSLIVFTSDNGMHLGEHRWTDKGTPYDESIRVPFVVRYDGIVSSPRADRHLVLNVDLAPTLAAAAGVRAPGAEGRDLLPLLASDTVPWRRQFLFEQASVPPSLRPPLVRPRRLRAVDTIPSYCGLRSERFSYVRYGNGEEELYDLSRDPHQLENVAGERRMTSRIHDFRVRLGELCRPPPPTAPTSAGD
jgi:N-acetylglucosamine-6-sulfatase